MPVSSRWSLSANRLMEAIDIVSIGGPPTKEIVVVSIVETSNYGLSAWPNLSPNSGMDRVRRQRQLQPRLLLGGVDKFEPVTG